MDIVFKGRHTDVLERFRKHASVKLAKVAKLDHKAIRVDVEVTAEHNPRQSGRRERVELTITTRGPAIRAEAAAEDRFAALDLALAKLESRLRRACDRRKDRHAVPPPARPEAVSAPARSDAAGPAETAAAGPEAPAPEIPAGAMPATRPVPAQRRAQDVAAGNGAVPAEVVITESGADLENLVAVQMSGDGPLVVREKFHVACPMTIDQALFEMELVGHDFFLFTDTTDGLPSVVYRRRGYQYGVIRLVEEPAEAPAGARPRAGEQAVPASR